MPTTLRVFLERDARLKRELQERLTTLLPLWFGQPKSNARYAVQAEVLDGYVAESEGVGRGLLLLKYHGALGAEVFWMAVEPALHRKGIGQALVEAAIADARKRGVRYLFVATLHPDDPDELYLRTRRFYEAMGFVYVLDEHFPADPENPLAYYLKPL